MFFLTNLRKQGVFSPESSLQSGHHTYKFYFYDNFPFQIQKQSHVFINYFTQLMTKIGLTIFVLSLLTIGIQGINQKIPDNKVVEIEPIAFDVIVPHYSRIIALFVENSKWNESVPLFEKKANEIMNSPDFNNNTLFALCNTSKDVSGKLEKYGNPNGIKYVTPVTFYQLSIPEIGLETFFDSDFPQFYQQLIQPDFRVYKPTQLQDSLRDQSSSFVVFPNNKTQLEQTKIIYQEIYDYLQLLDVHMCVVYDETKPQSEKNSGLSIYINGNHYSDYPESAIKALYNFTGSANLRELNDLVDFINIQTIDLVSKLDLGNYQRVFGNQLDSQLLFIYREKDSEDPQVVSVRNILHKVASDNKFNELKSHRVIFAEGTIQFLKEFFADQIITDAATKFKIIHTKTQYSTFQLRKYEYEQPVTQEGLTQFLEDVRLKRIGPNYKSEPIPQNNDSRKIRKIVGETFIKEIFEQKSKSVIVFFIDSKQEEAYQSKMKSLQEFTDKYYDSFKEYVNFGYFDLAKNEHQLLTISNAPELILFEKTNKKQPKFFRGKYMNEIFRNWMNHEIKDLTIPQNFGEPLLPLGSDL